MNIFEKLLNTRSWITSNQMTSRSACLSVVLIVLMITISPLAGVTISGEMSEGQHLEEHPLAPLEVWVKAPSQKEGNVHEQLTYDFEIMNNGTENDVYDWEAESGHGWLVSDQEGTTSELAQNETEIVSLTIEIPSDADPYTADRLVLNATSQTDPAVSDSGITYTYTGAVHSSSIEPDRNRVDVSLGSSFSIGYTLTNTGNVMDDFKLSARVDNPYWETSVQDQTGPMEPGESMDINVHVSVPEVTMEYKLEEKDIYYGATKSIVLRAEAENGVINTTSPIPSATVSPYYSATLRPVNPNKHIDFSETTTDIKVDLEVMNLCNIRDEEESKADINVTSEGKDFKTAVDTDEEVEAQRWSVSISAPNVTLEGGETDVIRSRITAPRQPINGTFLASFATEPYPHSDVPGRIETGEGNAKIIVNQSGDVNVSAAEEGVDGRPFEEVLLNFSVQNTGNGIDDYLLSSSTENGWKTRLIDINQTINNLHPEDVVDVKVGVKIPDRTAVGHEEDVELVATSLFEKDYNGETVFDSAQTTIRIGEGYSVILKPDMNKTTALPEETVSYQINVTNAGNTRDTITLSLEHESTEAWGAELETSSLSIERWNTTSTELHITPYSNAVHEEPFNVSVIGTSTGNSSKSDNASTVTQVVQVPDVSVDVNRTDISIKPGETLDLNVSVKNEGNAFDTFNLSSEANNTNWDIRIEKDLHELEPMAYGHTNISITAPEIPPTNTSYENLERLGILGGEHMKLILTASSRSNTSVSDSVEREIEVEEVRRHNFNSFERKDVLPGHSTTHRIKVDNQGNSEDTVYLTLEDDDNPYLEYVELEEREVNLDIGGNEEVNMTIEVPVHLQPYWHQEIKVSVGNEDFSATTETRTRVVVLDCEEAFQQIRVGKSASYDLTMVNVPTEEEIEGGIGMGDDLSDTFNLTGSFDRIAEEGWEISFSTERISFNEAYEEGQITVVLDSPGVETERVQVYEITAESRERELIDSVITETQMSWFDLRPIDISIEPGPDGRELDVIFKIERSGIDELFPIPFELSVNGEEIDQDEIEFVGSELIDDTEEVFTYETTYVLEEWAWEENIKEYEVSVNVDPDDEIYMINAAGNADENNMMTEEITVSRFHGIPYWLPFLLLVASLISFAGCWIGLKKNNGLSVGAGASLGGIFGSLVLLPWHWFISDIQTIDYIIMAVIGAGMLVFGLFLFAIRFKLKNMLSSVTEHIIQKNGWEKYVEKDTQGLRKSSSYPYYSALALTGALSYFVFLIFTSIDFLLIGEYLSIFTSRFLSIPYMIAIPNAIFFVVYPCIGIAVAFTASRLHEKLWKRILKNEKSIQQLRKRADNVMKGGERSASK